MQRRPRACPTAHKFSLCIEPVQSACALQPQDRSLVAHVCVGLQAHLAMRFATKVTTSWLLMTSHTPSQASTKNLSSRVRSTCSQSHPDQQLTMQQHIQQPACS